MIVSLTTRWKHGVGNCSKYTWKKQSYFKRFCLCKTKKLANDLISYECERRRGSGTTLSECKAKVKLNEDLSVVSYLHEHTHAADSGHVEVLKVRASIKRKAEETEETPQQILGQELQQLSQQAAVQMIPIRHLRRNIRRVEQSLNNVNLNQLFGGHMPQQPKKKYTDSSARISNIVADFDNREIKDYLKAIAFNISL